MTSTPEDGPEPDQAAYLDEPRIGDVPAPEIDTEKALASATFLIAAESPRDWQEALDWCRAQSTKRDKDWTGRCQEFSHDAWGVGGGFPSALAQFHGLPEGSKHVGGDPHDAPIGADLFSQSRDPGAASFVNGHIITKARPFVTSAMAAWSTDALRTGWPDRINPLHLYARWDHVFLGWGTNLNGVELQVKGVKPPQDQKYPAISIAATRLGNSLNDLRDARDTAGKSADKADVARLQAQIDAVKKQRATLLHLADTLRHS